MSCLFTFILYLLGCSHPCSLHIFWPREHILLYFLYLLSTWFGHMVLLLDTFKWHLCIMQSKPLSCLFMRNWREPPRKVSYKRTFGMPDQGQMLDVWESQTSESALRWRTRHIAPRHILELTLEVILEDILEHVCGIKTMTSLILDHVATAYLYLGINTGEKVIILFVVIVLELSQDSSWLNKHAPRSSLL
jgi:hypothetical protein